MPRIQALVVLTLLGTALWAAGGPSQVFTFAKADADKTPAGWKAAKTGEGEGSVWKVQADPTTPSKSGFMLTQTAEGPNPLFNLCVREDIRLKEVEISVAFKALRGKKDQGGGVVWRYQDANNYYVARANPLEANCRIYKVVAGKRIQLATKEELDLKTGAWHTLRIEHGKKGEIECYLDGKKLLSVDNETTIDKPGQIGLWTKADAQTGFDDLRVSDRSK